MHLHSWRPSFDRHCRRRMTRQDRNMQEGGVHLCNWLALPLGCVRRSLECRSCSCEGPHSKKLRITVSVSGPA